MTMPTLSDVFSHDEKIEERTHFEEHLLSFIADLLQTDNRKRVTTLRRDAHDLLAAWSAYTGRDVSEDLEYRLKLRRFEHGLDRE
jgi:hypothetical protein